MTNKPPATEEVEALAAWQETEARGQRECAEMCGFQSESGADHLVAEKHHRDSAIALRALEADNSRLKRIVSMYQENYKDPEGSRCACTFDRDDNPTTKCNEHRGWLERAENAEAELAALREQLSGSEAVFAFAAWLMSQPQEYIASANHNAAVWVELVAAFVKSQGLVEPRSDWHTKIRDYPRMPPTTVLDSQGEVVTTEGEG